MKGSKKGRFRLFAAVLIVGGALGLIVAQQVFLSPTEGVQEEEKQRALTASDKKPAEIEKHEKDKAPPVKERTRLSKNELLEKAGKKLLPASDKKPAEIEKLEKEKAPPVKGRTRPSVKELLEKVRKQPGGEEKVEAAKKSSVKIGAGLNGRDSSSWLDSFNLFKPKALYAQSSTSVTLTPSSPRVSTPFLCYMYIYGAVRGYGYNYSYRERLITSLSNTYLGTKIDNPYICLVVNAPSIGWYLINFETYSGAPATLRHSYPYETIQTWDQSGYGAWFDYPAVVYLAAGYHYFYWTVDSGRWIYFYRVTVMKI